MTTIHDRLASLRAGESLRAFAKAVTEAGHQVSAETVRKYELGPDGGFTTVPADYASAVCRVYARRLEWLIDGEGPERQVDPGAEVRGFREIAAIADRVRVKLGRELDSAVADELADRIAHSRALHDSANGTTD